MSTIYQSRRKIQETIKSSIFYIGLSLLIGNIFYYIALGINNLTKYLLRSIGFKPKTITYPKKEKDEDILGIWKS